MESTLFSLPGVAVLAQSKEGQCMSQRGGSLSCWIAYHFNGLCQGKTAKYCKRKQLWPEQKKDGWQSELTKGNRKHWSPRHVLPIIWTYSKPLGVWAPCSVETWRAGISPKSHLHEFWGALFFLRFWFQTKWALDATCLGGTGAAARALFGTGFLSSLLLSLLMVLSYRNLSNYLIQGSHQAPSTEKITPNPTLFWVCSLLEGGKNILCLLRCA